MRVLLIGFDQSAAKSMELELASEDMTCDMIEVGEGDIPDISKLYDYSIILLDLMLPDAEYRYEVLLRLRSAKIRIPVLILSNLSSDLSLVDQKIKGLGFDADDYLVKPFSKSELITKIQEIVRHYPEKCSKKEEKEHSEWEKRHPK